MSALTDCLECLNEAVRQLEVAIVEMDACIEYLGKAEDLIWEWRIAVHAKPNTN